MSENKYLVTAPLLDSKQQVLGYKLTWQGAPRPERLESVLQLLDFVGERVYAVEMGLLFFECGCSVISGRLALDHVPKNTVLVLDCLELMDGSLAEIAFMRGQGVRVALSGVDLPFMVLHMTTLLPLISYIELAQDNPDFSAIITLAKKVEPSLSVLVKDFPGWREFEACAQLGASGFFERLCAAPRHQGSAAALSPQAVLILQLMQMVQENADVRDIEGVLKRDATISYKLFRYINSPGFGLKVEIQSLRHAVAMLGYAPLFRWLSVLLATTRTAGFSPALLQAAMVRGRFAELLAQGFLSRDEAENLFFVGMFSLLDQLLGIPLHEVLRQVVLPDAVVQALLHREGVYGPFLTLVEACEREDGGATEKADALFVTAGRVNRSHLAALAWSHMFKP